MRRIIFLDWGSSSSRGWWWLAKISSFYIPSSSRTGFTPALSSWAILMVVSISSTHVWGIMVMMIPSRICRLRF
jgi:hypothetical protein